MDDLATRECTKCHQVKDLSGFPRDKSRKSGIFPWCHTCNRGNVGAHYWAKRPKIDEARSRDTYWLPYWYDRARAKALEIYGGCCAECGSTDKLEFDHVNNDGGEHRKREHNTSMYVRIARLGRELDDYELRLLCRPCHKHRHREDKAA